MLTLLACLTIGAIASSTDPLPIQDIFREMGVPKRVDLLVEGESLFADSTALVAYALLLAMLAGQVEGDLKTAFDFGQSIASQSETAMELGESLEKTFGRTVRLELAVAAATVRSYPGMKRGLGLTKACSLTPLEV